MIICVLRAQCQSCQSVSGIHSPHALIPHGCRCTQVCEQKFTMNSQDYPSCSTLELRSEMVPNACRRASARMKKKITLNVSDLTNVGWTEAECTNTCCVSNVLFLIPFQHVECGGSVK